MQSTDLERGVQTCDQRRQAERRAHNFMEELINDRMERCPPGTGNRTDEGPYGPYTFGYTRRLEIKNQMYQCFEIFGRPRACAVWQGSAWPTYASAWQRIGMFGPIWHAVHDKNSEVGAQDHVVYIKCAFKPGITAMIQEMTTNRCFY